MDNAYPDKILFEKIAEGDETAFKELFHFYVPLIEPVISNIIQSDAYVKDVVQEVFFRIWISREKLKEVRVPRDWIFRIVYYQSYSWLRQKKVRDSGNVLYNASGNTGDINDDAGASLSLKETGRLVRQAIEELTPQARTIYLLSREQYMKIPEIAAHLGISVQTVKNTLSRALKTIREYLEKYGVFLPLVLIWFI